MNYIHKYRTRSRTKAVRGVVAIQNLYRRVKSHTDPLTMEPVRFPVFTYVTTEGHETLYSAKPLAEYVRSSGSVRDPLTRNEFSRVELRRLSRISRVLLDPGGLERRRRDKEEAESLRAWFINDIEENIATIRTESTTSFLLSSLFPSLVVNVVRYTRHCDDESYESLTSELFHRIHCMIDSLRAEEDSPVFRTTLLIFNQFVRDLRTHVDNRTLLSGSAANINIGGLSISMNLRDI